MKGHVQGYPVQCLKKFPPLAGIEPRTTWSQSAHTTSSKSSNNIKCKSLFKSHVPPKYICKVWPKISSGSRKKALYKL